MTEMAKTRWGLILVIWAAGLGAAGQYAKISVVFQDLAVVYPTAGAGLSLTVSLVGLCGIVLGTVAGFCVSSIGFRRSLFWSLVLGGAMSLVQALHLPFAGFLVTRVIEGVSHLGIVVAGPTLIAVLASPKDRNLAMTLWGSFFGVSFAILSYFGTRLAADHGILMLFAAHGGLLVALAITLGIALRAVPAPARSPLPPVARWPALHRQIYGSAWKMGPAAGWLFYTCCFVALLTVLPPFLDPEWRTSVMAAMPLLSIASSLTLGVRLSRLLCAVRVVQVGFVLSGLVCLWLAVFGVDPKTCLVLAVTIGLIQGPSFASVPELNKTAVDQSQANGAMAQAGNAGNFIGTPVFVFALAAGGFPAMITVMATLLFLGAAAHWGLACLRRSKALRIGME